MSMITDVVFVTPTGEYVKGGLWKITWQGQEALRAADRPASAHRSWWRRMMGLI